MSTSRRKSVFRRLVELEAASGIVLLATAAIALVWANSPWADAYAGFRKVSHVAIDDGAMTLFFFVVGLEIRREVRAGALRSPRAAVLPLIAALGGMIVPAAIYLALAGDSASQGWGIPIATDIAFALGVLQVLGRRVPERLRVLLLALAIFDDIGAVVVVAVFYSSHVALTGLTLAAVGALLILAFRPAGVLGLAVCAVSALVIWLGLYLAGIHPVLAGVIVAFVAPPGLVISLERVLEPWVAFVVMPLFAFANAGVELHGLTTPSAAVGVAVAAGLVIGKPLGVLAASAAAVRLGIARLPAGIAWRHLALLGVVAGIGFTMSLFVAELAFAGRDELLAAAKVGILAGSAVSAALALLLARSRRQRSAFTASTTSAA